MPQSRRRLILLAASPEQKLPQMPVPKHSFPIKVGLEIYSTDCTADKMSSENLTRHFIFCQFKAKICSYRVMLISSPMGLLAKDTEKGRCMRLLTEQCQLGKAFLIYRGAQICVFKMFARSSSNQTLLNCCYIIPLGSRGPSTKKERDSMMIHLRPTSRIQCEVKLKCY